MNDNPATIHVVSRETARHFYLPADTECVLGALPIAPDPISGEFWGSTAHYPFNWPTRLTLRDAARQPWPCHVVLPNAKGYQLCEVDPECASTDMASDSKGHMIWIPREEARRIEAERAALAQYDRRVVLRPLTPKIALSQELKCDCGHVERRSKWLRIAANPSWDGCPGCKKPVRFDETPARLTLHPKHYPWPTQPGYDSLSCECGQRFEREHWCRCEGNGGCPHCARQLNHDDIYGAYEEYRAKGGRL